MWRTEVRKLLFDVAEACELVQQFTAGKTFEDYTSDAFLRSAVERQFEIIGEALGQALRSEPSLSHHSSNTRRIIAFRNRLIHAYSAIAHEVVWGILEVSLPVLLREVRSLLEEPGAAP